MRKAAVVLMALALLVPVGTVSAEARVGGGFSFGSRGTRSFSAPPPTATAPRSAFPLPGAQAPGLGGQSFGQPRRFGFGSGLAAGLLGAGLFGLLTGNGFFGGLGGVMSLVGLLIQIGLVILVVRLGLAFLRGRSGGTAFAGAPNPTPRSPLGGLGGNGLGAGNRTGPSESIPITPADFTAFERNLSDIQYAFGREDMTALARMTTPEMLRELGAEIEANRRRNLRNDMAEVRLLQGDLAESWREGPTDYATVAMRFAGRDVMMDRASGRIVSGDPNHPVEATELWTFCRDGGGGSWRLSAIQQTK